MTDEEIAEKAECLIWCQCLGEVREGGMCNEDGFCTPEALSPTCPVDRTLIVSFGTTRETSDGQH